MKGACCQHIDKRTLASVLQSDQGELHLLLKKQAACIKVMPHQSKRVGSLMAPNEMFRQQMR